MRVGNAVLRLNHRVIDLRNANEEDAVSTVHHEQSLVAERIRKPCARCEIVRLEPNFSRGWEQWIRYQSCRGECLQVPANTEAKREPIGHTYRVLRKRGVFVRVRMGSGAAEILHIIVRHLMSVGAKWRKAHAGFHGLERVGIDLDRIKKIFAALLVRKEVEDLGEQRIPSNFQR